MSRERKDTAGGKRLARAALLLALCVSAAPSTTSAQSVASRPAPTWRLVEDLRIGDDADGPAQFGEIRGLVSTKAGNIFVLDYKAMELRVFDARGKFVRLAARRGHGPGEIADPNGIAIGNDDVVVVSDPSNGRFSYYSADGKYVRQVLISITGYGDYWNGRVDAAGRIVDVPVRVPSGGNDPRTGYPNTIDKARRIRPDGTADTVAWPRCAPEPPTLVYRMRSGNATSMIVPFSPYPQTVVARQGTVWCTPSAEYRLSAGVLGGAMREVVHVNAVPLAIGASERNAAIARLDSFAVKLQVTLVSGDAKALPKSHPVISRLLVDDDGRAWVARSDLKLPFAMDVFAPTGQQLAQLRGPYQLGTVVQIGPSTILTAIDNADGVPVVVRYRIVR
ncbi:MAG: 6-bladed beta-propeller [Gemmatimonas sp.]